MEKEDAEKAADLALETAEIARILEEDRIETARLLAKELSHFKIEMRVLYVIVFGVFIGVEIFKSSL